MWFECMYPSDGNVDTSLGYPLLTVRIFRDGRQEIRCNLVTLGFKHAELLPVYPFFVSVRVSLKDFL